MDKQFKEVFLYDAAVVLDPDKPDAEKNMAGWLDDRPDVTGYLPSMNETISVIHDTTGRTYEATLVVPAPGYDHALPSFYNLHRRGSVETIVLPDQGAVLSEKLADLLGVQAGDRISTRDSSDRSYQIEVAAIAENYLSHYIYLSPKAFDALTLRTPAANTIVVTFDQPDAVDRTAFQESVMSRDGVLGSMFVLSVAEDFQDTIASLDYVVIILILAAGALAFVVLYNLTNINITERVREIATIKVLGFRDQEVASYVYRENVILTLIGTFTGLGLGVFLHRFVMETMEIDNMMFGKSILGMSYVYSIILTMGFAVLVNIFMYYKLRSVNMVESLKSVE
jgi:putative ABC transport system permease protein